MKILIVGLGMIGASYAKALTDKGYEVYGVTRTQESINKAKDWKIIKDGGIDASKFIPLVDLIVIGLYPKDIVEFINKYNHLFKENQVITDVAGVKNHIEEIQAISKCEFIGSHPMAGSEKSGIDAIKPEIFRGANFLITPRNNSERAISMVSEIANAMGFGKITIMTPEYHDEVISFTSQLTHAIAVSLVNSDTDENTPSHTGDSYRELTRIAMINERLWSELFLSNKNNLIKQIDKFTEQLELLKNTLVNDDKEQLEKLMISSCEKRKRFLK